MKKRIISLAIALLLVCGMPVSAFADTWYVDDGNITVNATESGQTVSQGETTTPDDAPVITQHDSSISTTNTVTINAAENAEANVTLSGVNIYPGDTEGFGIQTTGAGDVFIELDGTNKVVSGDKNAALEKNNDGNLTIADSKGDGSLKATGGNHGAGIGGGNGDSGSHITISGGTVAATGGNFGAGIGGGYRGSGSDITISGSAEVDAKGGESGAGIGGGYKDIGSDITITGSAEVTAKGGESGAGIGGGYNGSGSNITITEDAQVKAQGGINNNSYATGAAIGNGGKDNDVIGDEVEPNTDELTPNGKIEYYAPGANMETADPVRTVIGSYVPPQDEEKPPVDEEKPDQPSQSAEESAADTVYSDPLYRVIDQNGEDIPHKAERKDGVLTVTVDADFASLTGSLGGINALKEQGIETIVFITNGASSAFALSDLLAQGSTGDSYTLNHNGDTVSFTLDSGADLGNILK